VTNFEIAQARLRNQRISGDPLDSPGQVAQWLVAVQAQDYAGAQWALGLRLSPESMAADVDRALAEGTILRTHVLRPTWHFVAPADIRWLLALTAPRVHAINGTMYRQQGLDSATLTRSHRTLAAALEGGRQLTREELRDTLERDGITTGGLRLAYIIMSAELDGVICSGARRGKQFTYALLDDRAPDAKALAREDALAELAGRYFRSRGPATVQDLAKWSGLTVADARRGLEAVEVQLESETIGDRAHWFPPPGAAPTPASPSAYLLSIYDEYVSGYKDHSAIGGDEVGARLMALGSALRFIIVIDGRIAGTWRRTLRKDAVVIETDLFRPLTEDEQHAVALAADRYAAFLGLPAQLDVWRREAGASELLAPPEGE
jgi:hypothetical protein